MSKLELFNLMSKSRKEIFTQKELLTSGFAKYSTIQTNLKFLIKNKIVIEVQRGSAYRERLLKLRVCDDCLNPDLDLVELYKLGKFLCQSCFIKLRKTRRRMKYNPKERIY